MATWGTQRAYVAQDSSRYMSANERDRITLTICKLVRVYYVWLPKVMNNVFNPRYISNAHYATTVFLVLGVMNVQEIPYENVV